MRAVSTLLDWIYPRTCAGCGGAVEGGGGHVCWDCMAELHVIQPPYCAVCGDPVSGRVDHAFVCSLCSGRPLAFEAARSAVRYEGAAAEAIRTLKYHGGLWVVPDLATLLEAAVRAHYPDAAFDVVTWIPLHHAKRRERGFNQAAELGRALARRLGLPAAALARRIRPTPTQTHLTVPQRAANVRHAFRARVSRGWRGCRALLVDDVMTTGATAHACAEAIRAGGAGSVRVMTVARG